VSKEVNNDVDRYFQIKKLGLHLGGSPSPMLFNTVINLLDIMIERAKKAIKLRGYYHT
jgi:hypothetical protein